MANHDQNSVIPLEIDIETLREILRMQTIAAAAVHKAQAENRRLGIPNWYSINGHIVSDQHSNSSRPMRKDSVGSISSGSTSRAPDLGTLEVGKPQPVYGPRR